MSTNKVYGWELTEYYYDDYNSDWSIPTKKEMIDGATKPIFDFLEMTYIAGIKMAYLNKADIQVLNDYISYYGRHDDYIYISTEPKEYIGTYKHHLIIYKDEQVT